ncbi:MAG TPA: intradiol ring-cleavage dioxygenase [Bryobacteraceae bacterium]|nr:intradiol ring-cleavage dioxygenase [Bryobacteraceae bacterium]
MASPSNRFSRRDFALASFAGFAAWTLAGAQSLVAEPAASACGALDVELTEGPYYLDRGIYRQRITEDRPGLPLHLRLTVLDARTCQPIQNAAVEIWHCDAAGLYSGYTRMNPNGMGGPGGPPPGPPPDFRPSADGHPPFGPPPGGGFHKHQATDNSTFCRGLQLSDARGLVEFETLYPGWYMGRDVHIHLKAHSGGAVQNTKYQGGHITHTGQLFFADALTEEVASLQPYAARTDVPRTKLDEDMVYGDAHGAAVMLSFTQIKSNSLEAGLLATATLHIDPTATRVEHGPGGGPRRDS